MGRLFFTAVLFGIIINFLNCLLIYTFFRNPVLAQEPRYILYMQLFINDTITVSLTVTLFVLTYTVPAFNVAICGIFVLIGSNVYKNTPLNLAGMAIERFVAVCYPLHHARICTIRNTKILIGIIWLVGAAPGVVHLLVLLSLRPLSFFTSSRVCLAQNVFDFEYYLMSHAFIHITYMCSVWVLLIYTSMCFFFFAKAAASEPAQAQKARRTILLHAVQLLLCTLSLSTTVLDRALKVLFPYYQSVIYFCTFVLTNIVPYLLSPLIYGMRDQK
ncbi:odorant receptor 131-2-like [Garra rufa]|uniref:odorant receptor 131-2-like n=1 Tax=Garra rufa TaxID=137080 RepID=UPI003CCEE5E8